MKTRTKIFHSLNLTNEAKAMESLDSKIDTFLNNPQIKAVHNITHSIIHDVAVVSVVYDS